MMPAYCACGARRYASESEARKAEPHGAFKCPNCHTFATDHECRCDARSDFRCWDCDIRHGSHGGPPHDYPATAAARPLGRNYGEGTMSDHDALREAKR